MGVTRAMEGRVRPEPGSAVFQILSDAEKETRDRCQICEQLPEQAGHCSLEKAEEESDCLGQVGNGSSAEDGDWLSPSPTEVRMRGNRLQLWQEGFRLDIWENFL